MYSNTSPVSGSVSRSGAARSASRALRSDRPRRPRTRRRRRPRRTAGRTGAACHRPRVAAQPRRERQVPLAAPPGRPGDRVEHAVDDERPEPVREHVGVGLAEHASRTSSRHRSASRRRPPRAAGRGRARRWPSTCGRGSGRPCGRRRDRGSGRRPPTRRNSSRVIGKANGVKYGSHSSALSKQRSGSLRLMPRGSKPTRSNRSRTSWVNRKGAANDRELHARSRPVRPG